MSDWEDGLDSVFASELAVSVPKSWFKVRLLDEVRFKYYYSLPLYLRCSRPLATPIASINMAITIKVKIDRLHLRFRYLGSASLAEFSGPSACAVLSTPSGQPLSPPAVRPEARSPHYWSFRSPHSQCRVNVEFQDMFLKQSAPATCLENIVRAQKKKKLLRE